MAAIGDEYLTIVVPAAANNNYTLTRGLYNINTL